MDFGITGIDVIEERRGENGALLILHEALGFGVCALTVAVPEEWENAFLPTIALLGWTGMLISVDTSLLVLKISFELISVLRFIE